MLWLHRGRLHLFANKGGTKFRNDDLLLLRSDDGGQWAGDRWKAGLRCVHCGVRMDPLAVDAGLARLRRAESPVEPRGPGALRARRDRQSAPGVVDGATGNPASVDTNRQWTKAIRFSAWLTNDQFLNRANRAGASGSGRSVFNRCDRL